MLDMVITNVLYEKVVGNEYEEDGVPFVELKDRGGGGVLVAYFVEALFEELVGKHVIPR